MQPLKGLVWGCALAVLATTAAPARAGWNNVFQVCCNHCGGSSEPVVAAYADPCPQPCPQQVCTTRYIQRTYYQPVTSYRMSTYYQPVTTHRTSYYWEPVCSYRYSCYWDPCTCSYQRAATPVTSYRLRSQCCPVTTYLQRCCMTPVTTYRAACYYEPVTTCCQVTPPACPDPCRDTTRPSSPDASIPGGPPVTERDSAFPPGTAPRGDRTPDMLPTPPSKMYGEGAGTKHTKPPAVRLDRIASRGDANLEGRIVDGNQQPRSRAKVLFVSVERKSNQQTVTTERDGSFRAELATGGWLVYTYDENDKPVFSRRVDVPRGRSVQLTLVNR